MSTKFEAGQRVQVKGRGNQALLRELADGEAGTVKRMSHTNNHVYVVMDGTNTDERDDVKCEVININSNNLEVVPTYKVGDRVEFLGNGVGFVPGAFGIVTEARTSTTFPVRVRREDEPFASGSLFMVPEFKPAPLKQEETLQQKFPVGSFVEVLTDGDHRGPQTGYVGEVIGHTNNDFHVGVQFAEGHNGLNTPFPAGKMGWWFRATEIKTVEKPLDVCEFKEGDRLVAIETASGVTEGTVYTVSRVQDPQDGGRALIHTTGSGPVAFAQRFKLAPLPEPVADPRCEFKVGDKLEVVDATGGHGHKVGDIVTVQTIERAGDAAYAMVVLEGKNMWSGRNAAYAKRFKLAPAPEVVVVEKTALQVGDKVRLLSDGGFGGSVKVGDTGTVSTLPVQSSRLVNVLVDGGPEGALCFYYGSETQRDEIERVVEKPKSKSQKIEKHEIQKGDLIVAFWNEGGVETRRKGIAHENDDDNDWMTPNGGYLTWDEEAGTAEHIYLIERSATAKVEEPLAEWEKELLAPTGYAALDKTKTYFLKHGAGTTHWYLAYVNGGWKYGNKGRISNNATYFEDEFTDGTSAWEKPVEYVEPPKSIQEQLDELGVEPTDLFKGELYVYQFLGEGTTRYNDLNFDNKIGWTHRKVSSADVEHIKAGSYTKIS